jgi:hypothetical protein
MDPLSHEPGIVRVLRVMQTEGIKRPLTTNDVAELAGCARSTASGHLNSLHERPDVGVHRLVQGVWEFKQLPGERLLTPLGSNGVAPLSEEAQEHADENWAAGRHAETPAGPKVGDLFLMEHLGSTAGGRILVRDTESGVRYLLDPMVK